MRADTVVTRCTDVAWASGGLLGAGKVSDVERLAIEKVGAETERDHPAGVANAVTRKRTSGDYAQNASLRVVTLSLFRGVAAMQVRMRMEFAAAVAVAVRVNQIGAAQQVRIVQDVRR